MPVELALDLASLALYDVILFGEQARTLQQCGLLVLSCYGQGAECAWLRYVIVLLGVCCCACCVYILAVCGSCYTCGYPIDTVWWISESSVAQSALHNT
jgi:hypothetical protein